MQNDSSYWINSLSESEGIEITQSLQRACRFTARFWANILKQSVSGSSQPHLALYQAKIAQPLNLKLIEQFQQILENLIFEEISELGYDPENDEDALNLDRWVGCFEYGPNTYLAEVAETLSISVLHFPPRTGWYVSPGKVINLSSEIRRFNFTEESLN